MRVLVTRPAADAEPLLRRLAELGHEAVSAPLMVIAPRAVAPPDLGDVQGLLFTSANGVRAFAALCADRTPPALCVGAATAAAATAAGFADARAADGDVVALTEMVAASLDPAAGRLIHIAGDHRAGDLAGDLRARGFTVDQLVAYEARAVDALPQAACDALRAGALDVALFHSPRTAKLFAQLVRAAGLEAETANLAALALSPAALAAADLPFHVMRAPDRPEQEAMLALLADIPPAPATPPSYSLSPSPNAPFAGAPISEPIMSDAADALAADSSPAPAETPPRRGGFGAGLFGGIVGAALIVGGGVGGALATKERWASSLVPPAPPAASPEAVAALEGKIAALEARLRRLETAPAPETFDTRLNKLEEQLRAGAKTAHSATQAAAQTAAARASAAAAQIAAQATAAADATAAGVADAKAQMETLGAGLLEDLRARIDQLENALSTKADAGALASVAVANTQMAQSVGAFDDRIAKAEKAAETGAVDQTRRAALAVSVAKLDQAARSGAPYAPLLRAARALAADDPTLNPAFDTLAVRAEKGLATVDALRRSFPELARKAKALDMAEGEQGWRAEVLRFFGELVTVRRTGTDPSEQDLDAKLARAEARLHAGDLAGAVSALNGLPAQAGGALGPWLADARARLDGDLALTTLAERTLVLLAAPAR